MVEGRMEGKGGVVSSGVENVSYNGNWRIVQPFPCHAVSFALQYTGFDLKFNCPVFCLGCQDIAHFPPLGWV